MIHCVSCNDGLSCNNCEAGYYFETNSCNACTDSHCLSCSSSTDCDKCVDGFYVNNN